LTKNILEHIQRTRKDGSIVARGRGLTAGDWPAGGEERFVVTVDAYDEPGEFSQSPEARKLVEQYRSPGGPLFDYLIELCELLKEKYPGVMVKTLGYRRSQTQIPPVLPDGKKFPDNFLLIFAPVEDCFLGDWSHPDLAETRRHFLDWSKLVKNLWVWMYPNPYGAGTALPFADVQGMIDDIRKYKEGGATGVFLEHGPSTAVVAGGGFTELQAFLFNKLTQDVNCDTDALIREFTGHRYGAAAPLVRKYLVELEQSRRAISHLPKAIGICPLSYDEATFPYLTADNIHRWQGYFDEMFEKAGGDERPLANVKRLRRDLDVATLLRWFDLAMKHPGAYRDHQLIVSRIAVVNGRKAPPGLPQPKALPAPVEDLVLLIEAGGKKAPLPAEVSGGDPSQVQQFVPRHYNYSGAPQIVKDPDAAFGYAAPVDKPDLPFQAGFYQWTNRKAPAGTPSGNHGSRLSIPIEEITPGAYKLYKLGPITITPDSWLWFSAQSWATRAELGEKLYVPEGGNQWDAWVSLKFDGPAYRGTAAEDQVLCDRIILAPALSIEAVNKARKP
jgi:hypothetical protein